MSENQGKRPLALVKSLILGLGFSAAVIAAFALIFLYLIPALRSPDKDWESVENRGIVLRYKAKNFSSEDIRARLRNLVATKNRVASELNLDPEQVPEEVYVYLHEDVSSLKSTISERKSSSESDLPLGLMDVIDGRDSERVLVRLLLTFAWGRPSSELLRLGLENYLSDKYVDASIRAAALKDSGFTIPQIVKLARITDYLKSLQDRIYDNFDSPKASAGLSLGTFGQLTRFDESKRKYGYRIGVRAQSFISYLLKKFDVNRFRALWEADSLEEGVKEVLDTGLTELEKDWKSFLASSTDKGVKYRYYRARTLLARGELDRARSELAGLSDEDALNKNVTFLLGTIEFYRGNWEKAKAVLSSLNSERFSPEAAEELDAFSRLNAIYWDGQSLTREGLEIFLPADTENVSKKTKEFFEVIERKREKLPDLVPNYPRTTVFLVKSSKSFNYWQKVDLPDWVAVLREDEELKPGFAEALVSTVTQTPTYSSLLRQGLIHYLAEEGIYERGYEILASDNWTPLDGAVFATDGSTASGIQAAAFIGYVIDQYGSGKFVKIWRMTTPLGGDRSLEYALRKALGQGLEKTEADLKDFLRDLA